MAVPYSASSEGKYRFKNDIHFKEFVRSPTTRRSSSGSKTLTPLVTQTASLEVRKEDLLCDYCHELIHSEFYVRGIFLKCRFFKKVAAFDKNFHTNHLVCGICGIQVPLKFRVFADKKVPFCEDCFCKELMCILCNKPINESYIESDSKNKYHQECYYPHTCVKCNTRIRGI